MCGIVGVVTQHGTPLNLPAGVIERMRDRLAHRGPDDSRTWRTAHAALGFRRLAILDPSDAGAQPMTLIGTAHGRPGSPDGGLVLLYNGELYNDAQVRHDLGTHRAAHDPPLQFQSRCDAETVLHAWQRWGEAALDRLRGMFALAVLDLGARTLTLARDPLGIKPLVLWRGAHRGQAQVAFASEPAALLKHPAVSREPDPITLSAYLTTIRTTLGKRTMWRDVQTIEPGEVRRFHLDHPELPHRARTLARSAAIDVRHTRHPHQPTPAPRHHSTAHTRDIVRESIAQHLRADRPIAAMLSGGLDSAIIVRTAADLGTPPRTYAAGAHEADPRGDLEHAAALAASLGLSHRSILVDEAKFLSGWAELTLAHDAPLSTPNEIAISALARAMRRDGCVVALSGEGADELFGGYEAPLRAAAEHVAAGDADPGAFHLDAHAWVSRAAKPSVLAPAAWRAAEHDEPLLEAYRRAHTLASAPPLPADNPRLAAHLRMHRMINLPGLLSRLDSATMHWGVEGRTPLADTVVAAHADALSMGERFALHNSGGARTKIALRRAFADRVSASILGRAKASFPLPFQRWMARAATAMRDHAEFTDWISPAALALVRADPAAGWPIAWPVLNLALWLGAIDRAELIDPAHHQRGRPAHAA